MYFRGNLTLAGTCTLYGFNNTSNTWTCTCSYQEEATLKETEWQCFGFDLFLARYFISNHSICFYNHRYTHGSKCDQQYRSCALGTLHVHDVCQRVTCTHSTSPRNLIFVFIQYRTAVIAIILLKFDIRKAVNILFSDRFGIK